MILLGPPGLGKLMWPWRWRKRPFSPDSCLLYDRPRSGNRSRARLPGRTADRRLRIYLAPRSSSSMEWGICRWTIWARPSSFSLSAPGYEKGSIILIFNESYGQWGSIFGDPIIATAILDRLLHHSTTVNIRGDSYRLKERRKAGLLPSGKRTSKDLPLSPVATASRPSFRLRNERVPGSSIGSLANRRCRGEAISQLRHYRQVLFPFMRPPLAQCLASFSTHSDCPVPSNDNIDWETKPDDQ